MTHSLQGYVVNSDVYSSVNMLWLLSSRNDFIASVPVYLTAY
jgi:hypothetical protein